MGSSKRFKRNCFVIFLFLCLFIGFSMSESQQQANAQLIPLPPPSTGPNPTQSHLEPTQARHDNISSPLIEFLTTSLTEGKNVLKVKITDKSDLRYAAITYVQNGNIVTQGLVRDPGNVYKALIDARSPSALIVIDALDISGQKASVVKQLNVTSFLSSILGQISNLFFDVGKTIVGIFAPTKH
jgi:hypothetical protein